MNNGQNQFTLHQRLALGLFVVIGLATFALGAIRVTNTIFDPLRLKGGGGTQFKTAEQVERERNDALRTQDTDKDELNDYDELYVFRTSPFLEDTDSDGELDGKEVAAETDPNCPKGRTCRAARVTTTVPATGEKAPTSGLSTTVTTNNTTTTSVGSTATTGSAPPQAASPEQISAAIAETFGDPNTLTTKQVADGIAKMSSVQLRAFLIKLGVPQKVLDKTDDATLRQLLSDSLNEMVK